MFNSLAASTSNISHMSAESVSTTSSSTFRPTGRVLRSVNEGALDSFYVPICTAWSHWRLDGNHGWIELYRTVIRLGIICNVHAGGVDIHIVEEEQPGYFRSLSVIRLIP
jgi:hypothetical protein